MSKITELDFAWMQIFVLICLLILFLVNICLSIKELNYKILESAYEKLEVFILQIPRDNLRTWNWKWRKSVLRVSILQLTAYINALTAITFFHDGGDLTGYN
jgi:hypothetical protein